MKLLKFVLVLAAMLLLLWTGCRPEGFEKIDYKELDIDWCCLHGDTAFVFTDDSTYQHWLSDAPSLPEIDFSKYVLVGKSLRGGCAESCYRFKKLLYNEEEHELLIVVNHPDLSIKCSCKKLIEFMYWFRISKAEAPVEVKIDLR